MKLPCRVAVHSPPILSIPKGWHDRAIASKIQPAQTGLLGETDRTDEAAIREHFGTFKIANQHENTTGEYPVGVASVLYDVLNNIALDSIIAPSTAYEVDLAIEIHKIPKGLN